MQELPGEYHFKPTRPALLIDRPIGSRMRPRISLLPGLLGHLRVIPVATDSGRDLHSGTWGPQAPAGGGLASKSRFYTLPFYLCTICDLHGVNSHPFRAQALPPPAGWGCHHQWGSPAWHQPCCPRPRPSASTGSRMFVSPGAQHRAPPPQPLPCKSRSFPATPTSLSLAKTKKGSFMWLKSPTVIM